MAKQRRGGGSSKGEAAENVAVDTTGTVAKLTSAVAGAAVIGVVKGLGKAVWRGVRPQK